MNDLQRLKASLQNSPSIEDAKPSDFEPLLQHLRANGMGKQVDSWIGDGPNEAVDPMQLEQALAAPGSAPGSATGFGGGLGSGLGGGILGTILGGLLHGGASGASGGGPLGGKASGGSPWDRAGATPPQSGGGGLGGAMGSIGGGVLGGLLAQALPYIINAMSPRGRIADEDVPAGRMGEAMDHVTKPGYGRLPEAPADSGGLGGMLGRALGPR